MEIKQNLHTHTNLCDGLDSPEELVLAAIDKGFDSIGFSAHSYMKYSKYLGGVDRTEEYKQAVRDVQKAYGHLIKIYLGIEVDMYSEPDLTEYDYAIGSVHYLKVLGEPVSFDRGEQEVAEYIDRYFGGDGMAYAKAYYQAVASLPEYGKFDIIGHFDLITKHCENRNFFDTSSDAYIHTAFEAAEALVGKIPFFEVNTGAIARGYRTSPYPSVPIIKRLKELGFGAVITSDCHDKAMLDCHFSEAEELLKSCGFCETYILTDNGFVPVSL